MRTIQYLLREHRADLDVDGKFGTQTERAVRELQRTNGLSVDDAVELETWPALMAGP